MPIAILWPTFALVAVIYAVWLALFVQRSGYMKRQPAPPEAFATRESAMRYFAPVEASSSNLINLFEMPVLYFALVPLLLVTHHGNHVQVLLAWAFVALRALHSVIHISRRPHMQRFFAYFLSCIVLSAMWIGFAVDMAAAPGF